MSDVPALFTALALPACAAWILIGPVVASGRSPLVGMAARAAIAALLGIGLSSLVSFAYLMLGGALDRTYVIFDSGLFVALGVGAYLAQRVHPVEGASIPRRKAIDVVAGVVVAAALVLSVAAFVRFAVAAPHGQWDAWAIWNLRARFLFRAGSEWRRAFSPELGWSQLGYPLLLPLTVARAWAYGGETTVAPAVVAAVFTFASPVALGATIARIAGNVAGAIAALVLLATADFTVNGAYQFADVPVAAFLVAALGTLLLASEAEGVTRDRRLIVAGLLLGLAGWTKNEGIAAAGCAVCAHAALTWRRGGRRVARDLGAVAIGAFAPAAAWIAFHAVLVPAIAPAFAGAEHGAVRNLLDPERWRVVLAGLGTRFPGREHQLPFVAIVLAVLLGVRPRLLLRSMPLVASALLLGVYVLIYLVTPLDLQWHLAMSAGRVLLQPWPSLLLGLFVAVPDPAAQRTTVASVAAGEPTSAGAGEPDAAGAAEPDAVPGGEPM
ncbi:MAG TPA: hypothetical protein VF912_04060 [Anaeromyxobacter sp.]